MTEFERDPYSGSCVTREDDSLDLSVRDSRSFVDALLNPKPVNGRLCETVRRYREATKIESRRSQNKGRVRRSHAGDGAAARGCRPRPACPSIGNIKRYCSDAGAAQSWLPWEQPHAAPHEITPVMAAAPFVHPRLAMVAATVDQLHPVPAVLIQILSVPSGCFLTKEQIADPSILLEHAKPVLVVDNDDATDVNVTT
jgi:hypothetical protein